MPDALKARLKALTKMRHGDRRAILALLSNEERAALAAQAPRRERVSAGPAQAPRERFEPPPCSPWLNKRLIDLASGAPAAASATETARESVRRLIARAPVGHAP